MTDSVTAGAASTHLDLDGLADHLAGETDAGEHLSACGGCTARLAELEAADRMVAAALRLLSDPPMPADVVDRITVALRAELPSGAVVPDLAVLPGVVGGATVTPLLTARVARRRAWLPSVAAAAVLVAGGLLSYGLLQGYGLLPGGSGGEAATSAAAPLSADSGGAVYPTVSSGLDYADPAAVTKALPGVLDGSTAALSSAQSAPDPAAVQAAPAPSGAASRAAPLENLAAPDPLARLREPAALADCLAALLDPARPDDQPLALDYASYRGAPALAVVLPDTDPGKVAIFVVGPDCSRADDGLVFFTRLARP